MGGSNSLSKNNTPENLYVYSRKKMVDWIKSQLVGSGAFSDEESSTMSISPTDRFPCGALYPTSRWGDGIDPSSEDIDDIAETGSAESQATVEGAEPVAIKRYIPPSSLGFSFFIKGDDIQFQVLCNAVGYHHEDRNEAGQFYGSWKRYTLKSTTGADEDFENIHAPSLDLGSKQYFQQSFYKFDEKARLDILWRAFADGWIVTISLSNAQSLSQEKDTGRALVNERAQMTLFEVGLRCVFESGEVGVYPRVDRSLLDDEEQEIELQYSPRHVYAIGHGCAAEWLVKNSVVTEIRSDTMPTVEVPQMTADTGASDTAILSLSNLSNFEKSYDQLIPLLNAFINSYADWIASQKDQQPNLNVEDQAAATRIIERMHVAESRMRVGLKRLSEDAQIRLAFALANQAMLEQMRQHDKIQGKDRAIESYRWRPFQLAFILTTLESTENTESEYRDLVDLIWFPTGGGKTEAYLGLVAFQIILRRLRYPHTGEGTSVIMRYTLRLLARDQFIRAIRLICALELIRRERDDLGTSPISIGMWVGSATSPNTYENVIERLNAAKSSNTKPSLVLDQCPWCGEPFALERNYLSGSRQFHFLCKSQNCCFGVSKENILPCNVVDEALYDNPPTMLIATIDKFARLAWEERANAFFGGEDHRPPELIIQDELHLIAGALGSVAGLYEAGLDTVIKCRGIYPKYIASTATIRMAALQVKRLYGRDLAVFPPPGLSCDDSFFAKTVPLTQRPGRLYVGYLAPMLNRQQCMAPLAAALLLAPSCLFKQQQDMSELMDAWWTQMVYHGSLKGVSNSHTAFVSNVRDFMTLISSSSDKERPEPDIAQLTSRQTAEQNSEIFTRLKKTRDEEGCLDAVLATNMISVGLDVSRLALMTINGQPLTTAEYIQASSRVGRSEVPGLVFVNYYRDQARSLSHYESFRPYHEAFYRFVEPTSVTPYTYQARMRALHAALVIVIRHARVGLLTQDSARSFRLDSSKVAKAIEQLKLRISQAAGEQTSDTIAHLDTLVKEWLDEIERCNHHKRQLSYQISDKDASRDRLLFNHEDKITGLWVTLQSLRNVENTALIKAI